MKDHVKWVLIVFFIIAALIAIGALYINFWSIPESNQENDKESHETFKRGPHQGRLLEKGAFQIEVAIFEPEGIPPRFRIYFYENGKPVPPADVKYQMKLERINRVEQIPFKQTGDYLESLVEAFEPHSFKVYITAEYKEKKYEWMYETYEGRVKLSPEMIEANKIKIEKAGPIDLEIALNVMGRIVPNEDLTVHLSPRFPGIVKTVDKKLGDEIQIGDRLAVIESNESLHDYEVKSEMKGMVLKKNINLGMYLTGQENIFVISDLSSVWADFNIYRQDIPQIKIGDQIQVKSLDGNLHQQSTISYISPLGHERTQSIIARAVLTNPDEAWKPNLFVSGKIIIEKAHADVAVKESAIQSYRGWDVVFISVDDVFEAVPVKLGKRNKEWVEITSGLSAGERYVSENSFILKADLEKAGATHDH